MSEEEKLKVHLEPIEKNRRIRGSLRTNITKLIKKIDEELASANPHADSLQESLIILIERKQKLGNLDDIIIFQSLDAEIETEMETSLEYSEQIIKYKSRINRYLSESVQVASERSYVCESIAERAGLKTVGKEKLKIFTFASNEASISELERKRITLKNCNSDLFITLEALETKTICASRISGPSTRMVELLQNEGFELSDSGDSSGRVDILIGNDYLSAVLIGRTHRLNNCLILYESAFGWTGRDGEFNERTVGKESAWLFIRSS
ncbi:DUF1758 domain-containing protein [Caerostris darwini]|uniref:DUF1758 domain-containing protein n=1 Tax=Caerostris darwini TaxID=1538125 RepID=A0AAV4TI05_9ARAC|nr:DUF1758 domain-containing protein [Caerostris darwini]